MFRIEPRGYPSRFWSLGSPILAIALTILVTGVIFAAMGQEPLVAVYTFLIAPLLEHNGLAALAIRAAPLILIGVGLSLCYRTNVWNIGAEGQFTLGAISGGGLALTFPDAPAELLFPGMLALGVIGGMFWAAIPAWLRTRYNANEILTSLMLHYIAGLLLVYLVTGPWKDPHGFGFPQSALFSSTATTPIIVPGTGVHLGCALAPLLAAIAWLVLNKSVLGFKLRVVGQAPRAARFAGFNEDRLIWTAMLISGGLAGLAGILEVAGPVGQLTTTISPGYGFSAVIVAFLGRLDPIGAVFAGLLLALSYLGGDAAQIDLGLPNAVTGIFQGILLFFLLGCDLLIRYRIKRVRPNPAVTLTGIAE